MPDSLSLIASTKDEKALLEHYVKTLAADKTEIAILEAGCGQKWIMKLDGVNYSLTGIDIDADALSIRKDKFDDLDESIVGDLRDPELVEAGFDVIYNAFVLEHIEQAETVLSNFHRWLKPGGIMIIKVPDRHSVYGFIAHHTPHWMHVSYYRYIKGCKNAGKPGHIPYPTVYDEVVSRQGFKQFCEQHGLIIELEAGKNNYLRKKNLVNLAVKVLAICGSIVTLGYLKWHHNDLIYIIRKPSHAA